MSDLNQPQQTYGERLVGKSFNPSSLPLVDEIKDLSARLIDIYSSIPVTAKQDVVDSEGFRTALLFTDSELVKMKELAIINLQMSQMWGVKAATWK